MKSTNSPKPPLRPSRLLCAMAVNIISVPRQQPIHHRQQPQGHDQRHEQRNGDRQPEIPKQRPGLTMGQPQRHKHAERRGGRTDQGCGHHLCALHHGPATGNALLPQPLNLFDHDDAIVDEDADAEGQPGHGHEIEAQAEEMEAARREQQGRGNGEGHEQRGPPGSQYEKQDQYRTHSAPNGRFGQTLQAPADPGRLVIEQTNVQLRLRLGHGRDHRFQRFAEVEEIAVGLLVEAEVDSGLLAIGGEMLASCCAEM